MTTIQIRRGDQGQKLSRMEHTLMRNSKNIFQHLSSRSVTRRRPHVIVHRHFNRQLLLTVGRSVIRKEFISAFGLGTFCEELVKGGLEELSSCIYYCCMFRSSLKTLKWENIHICTGFPSHRTTTHCTVLEIWWRFKIRHTEQLHIVYY
jgi:hypothetical protein